jgi:imidazole glycerol phosphate synthase glutamine amidotransferase subunit
MIREVVIIQTGIANIASVCAAFERLGARVTLTADPAKVLCADFVMLPGVGAFGAGMAALGGRDKGLGAALVERFATARPTMAICLGLQMLAQTSDETPGVAGLSIFEQSHVGRFDPTRVKVPQLGWNHVEPAPGGRLLVAGHAYFANSYRLSDAPPGWTPAWADHGGPFIAAVERGPHLACQFHPELSGPWGEALIGRWLEGAPC